MRLPDDKGTLDIDIVLQASIRGGPGCLQYLKEAARIDSNE